MNQNPPHDPCLAVCALLAFSMLPGQGVSPEDISRMVLRSPTPSGSNYADIATDGSTIALCTEKGEIVASFDDGATFAAVAYIGTAQGSAANRLTFSGIATSGNEWVAVSQDGPAVRSTDLITWTITDNNLNIASDVSYGGGTFVCTGFGGQINYSSDGVTWEDAVLPAGSGRLEGAAFGNGVHLAGGRDYLLISSDGMTWTDAGAGLDFETTGEWVEEVVFINDLFVVTGREDLLLTSPDGTNWTRRNVGQDGSYDQAYEDPAGRTSFFILSRSYLVSPEFDSVTQGSLPNVLSKIVRTDAGSLIGAGPSGRLHRRPPGSTEWQSKSSAITERPSALAFGAGLFVLVDDTVGKIFSSPDGTSWTVRYETSDDLSRELVFAEGIFCTIEDGDRRVSSTDGINWTTTDLNQRVKPNSLRFENGKWLAPTDSGKLFFSEDAVTWSETEIQGQPTLNDVTFGDGLYVLVGDAPTIFTSPDLANWTARTVQRDEGDLEVASYSSVQFGNGRFMAFPGFDTPALSEDGASWQRLSNQGKLVGSFTGYDDELGFNIIEGNSRVLYWPKDSTVDDRFIDGAKFAASAGLRGLVAGNGTLVAIGDSSVIMSIPISSAGYEAWVLEEFGAGVSETFTGIQRDPDEDHQTNLEEYARGTDPELANPPLAIEVATGPDNPQVQFTQRSDRDDLNAVVEHTFDLSDWLRTNIVRETEDLGGSMETVTGQLTGPPSGSDRRFFRVVWEFSE